MGSCILHWILNSIAKDIVDAFLYTITAKECNGPLLYQLQRDYFNILKDLSVVQYHTKLKKPWDELTCLISLPHYTCGNAKSISDINLSNHLIQILMGLNVTYYHIQNHLVMDPLPRNFMIYVLKIV